MTEFSRPIRSSLTAEALKALIECQSLRDTEEAHVIADRVLCDLLSELGYRDVVTEYEKVGKWYA